jgi:hypothetical protein
LEQLVVERPIVSVEDGQSVFSARITLGRDRHLLRYEAADLDLAADADPLLPAVLLAAMSRQAPVRLAAAISPRLLSAVGTIQDIFHAWDPTRLHPVEIQSLSAVPDAPSHRPSGGVGCFFTGGVDSWYSVLKHRDEITHLVYVHGFDVPLEDRGLRAKVSAMLREVAGLLRKGLVEVTSNLRSAADAYVDWDFYHGPGLASVALVLTPSLRKMYIPATHTYAALYSLGSHPLLDPLWSTEAVEIVHDGCESTRTEKVRCIAAFEPALRTLRVCWRNPDGAYNCGRCEKCLRTMIALRLAGVLDKTPTFGPLDLRAVSRIPITTGGGREHIEQNLRMAERWGVRDPALRRALEECLAGKYYRWPWTLARAVRASLRFRPLADGRSRSRSAARANGSS